MGDTPLERQIKRNANQQDEIDLFLDAPLDDTPIDKNAGISVTAPKPEILPTTIAVNQPTAQEATTPRRDETIKQAQDRLETIALLKRADDDYALMRANDDYGTSYTSSNKLMQSRFNMAMEMQQEAADAAAGSGMPAIAGERQKNVELAQGASKLISKLPFLGSTFEATHLFAINDSARRVARGEGTRTDMDLLNAFMSEMDRKNNQSLIQKVFDLATDLPATSIEFLLTGGGFTFTRKVIQKLGVRGLKKLIRRNIKSTIMRNVGIGVVRTALQTAPALIVQTLLNPQLIARQSAENLLNDVALGRGAGGRIEAIIMQEDRPWSQAIKEDFVGSIIDIASERTGFVLSKMFGKLGRAVNFDNFPLISRIKAFKGAVIRRWFRENPSMNMDDLDRLIKRSGFNGVLEEIVEERVADQLKIGIKIQKRRTFWETVKQIIVEGLAFSIVPMGRAGISMMGEGGPISTNEFPEEPAAPSGPEQPVSSNISTEPIDKKIQQKEEQLAGLDSSNENDAPVIQEVQAEIADLEKQRKEAGNVQPVFRAQFEQAMQKEGEKAARRRFGLPESGNIDEFLLEEPGGEAGAAPAPAPTKTEEAPKEVSIFEKRFKDKLDRLVKASGTELQSVFVKDQKDNTLNVGDIIEYTEPKTGKTVTAEVRGLTALGRLKLRNVGAERDTKVAVSNKLGIISKDTVAGLNIKVVKKITPEELRRRELGGGATFDRTKIAHEKYDVIKNRIKQRLINAKKSRLRKKQIEEVLQNMGVTLKELKSMSEDQINDFSDFFTVMALQDSDIAKLINTSFEIPVNEIAEAEIDRLLDTDVGDVQVPEELKVLISKTTDISEWQKKGLNDAWAIYQAKEGVIDNSRNKQEEVARMSKLTGMTLEDALEFVPEDGLTPTTVRFFTDLYLGFGLRMLNLRTRIQAGESGLMDDFITTYNIWRTLTPKIMRIRQESSAILQANKGSNEGQAVDTLEKTRKASTLLPEDPTGEQIMQVLGRIKTVKELSKFRKGLQAVSRITGNTVDALFEAFVNSLLGFSTFGVAVGSTFAVATAHAMTTTIASLNSSQASGGVSKREAVSFMYGSISAFWEALQVGAKAYWNNQPQTLTSLTRLESSVTPNKVSSKTFGFDGETLGIDPTANPAVYFFLTMLGNSAGAAADFSGKLINQPTRILMTLDEIMKTMLKKGLLHKYAMREVLNQNVTDANEIKKMVEMITNEETTPEFITEQVIKDIGFITATSKPTGRVQTALQQIIRSNIIGRFLVPFDRTYLSSTNNLLRHMPVLALLSQTAREELNSGDKATRDMAIARQVLGLGLIGFAVTLTKLELLTGSEPVNKALRNTLESNGWQSDALVAGGAVTSLKRIDLLGIILRLGADIGILLENYDGDEGDLDDLVQSFGLAMGRLVFDRNFAYMIRRVGQMIAGDSSVTAKHTLESMVVSLLTPKMLAEFETFVKPALNEVVTLKDRLMSRIAWGNDELGNKRDLFGDIVLGAGTWGSKYGIDIFLPTRTTTVGKRNALREMQANGVGSPPPPRFLTGKNPETTDADQLIGVRLTSKEIEDYQIIRSTLLHPKYGGIKLETALNRAIASKMYQSSDIGGLGRGKILKNIIGDYTRQATIDFQFKHERFGVNAIRNDIRIAIASGADPDELLRNSNRKFRALVKEVISTDVPKREQAKRKPRRAFNLGIK